MVWATPLVSLLALAASLTLSEAKADDVYTPSILYPHSHTQWKVGETHHVVWDVTNPPSEITNKIGQIYLVQNNLILFEHELASNFSILDGRVKVRVPNVPTGQYQLDLFGDSGDRSDYFAITNDGEDSKKRFRRVPRA